MEKDKNEVFVFGSNEAGRHGRGAALTAVRYYGAVYGKGNGIQGNSYAIPTKDERLHPLALHTIKHYVKEFLDYATTHPELKFKVTRIGCGLAGFDDKDISPMFKDAPDNCILPLYWR